MRFLASSAMLVLLGLIGPPGISAQAQGPAPVGVGFRNDLKVPVIVQGWSVIKGMQRRGQPVLVAPGRIAWESNVPPGARHYSIYDANQPSKILLRDRPVPVRNQDQFYGIIPFVNDPSRVLLQQEPVPQ